MRLTAFLAALALASPAVAAEVRVKSKHDRGRLEEATTDGYKVGAEETLRGGVIGPGKVRVTLRRLGLGKAAPLPVKVTRDGRDVAKLSVGGKLRDAVVGESDLAGPPVDKLIEIPAGPHTLFVEVGAGKGGLLVTFDEERAAPAIASRPPKPEVADPKAAPTKTEPAAPEVAAAKPTVPVPAKPESAAPQVAAAKPPAKPAEVATTQSPGKPASDPSPAPATAKPADADAPAIAASTAEKPAEKVVARPDSSIADPSAAPAPQKPAQAPGVAVAARRPAPTRVWIGPRVGVGGQTQLAALGPALGLSFRWAVAGTASAAGARGLLVGLSADALHYQIAFKVPARAGLASLTDELAVTSVPVLLEGTWSFGDPKHPRLTPYLGLAVGVSAGNLQSESPAGAESRTFVGFAAGAHLGLELPIGKDRLGLEARWLWSKISAGSVSDLEVGGALLQASWRFGI